MISLAMRRGSSRRRCYRERRRMRSRVNLNREWTFHCGDPPCAAGAEALAFDDSNWEPIGLPHTFDLPYFRTPEFYVGYGWYRKRFTIDDERTDSRLFLEFDGVFQI